MGPLTPAHEAEGLRMLQPGPEGFIDRILEPGGLPDWITQAEFDHYVGEFTLLEFLSRLELR